jgi:hypothetical protein
MLGARMTAQQAPIMLTCPFHSEPIGRGDRGPSPPGRQEPLAGVALGRSAKTCLARVHGS